ncbi:MAG: HlyD family efflux transporter periplasmic adaptor subunit [Lewinellaceae bacterium]|nr:HlyD family efflux transporter periplasmic adaptor subunit [Lewinellaceae bacterium]
MSKKNQYPDPTEIRLNTDRDDIQRILGNPPGWALRWGITALFVGVALVLGMAWLVKYPDVITARVVIVTENPPVRVFARSNGKISQLLVKDKAPIAAGQVIAVLENTAELEDVLQLEGQIVQLKGIAEPEGLVEIQLPEGLRLGELQSAYAAYQQAVHDFQFFERRQGVFARIASLKQQIRYLEGLNRSLEQQEQTLSREVAIAQNNLERNRQLFASGTISEVDFEQSETNYLQYRRQLESLQSRVLNNKLQIEQFQSEIIELRQSRMDGSMQKWLATRELLGRLDSELELWKQSYLVTSPITGRVSLTRVWGPQQFVQANEAVATVVPGAGAGEIVGKAALPTFNSGKVKPGMRTNIQLDGYPYQEFGVLQGQVKSIALVPDQETYLLEISLPDSLTTSYHRTIPFTQELPGQARIITEDRRILQRVFDQLISLVRNQ